MHTHFSEAERRLIRLLDKKKQDELDAALDAEAAAPAADAPGPKVEAAVDAAGKNVDAAFNHGYSRLGKLKENVYHSFILRSNVRVKTAGALLDEGLKQSAEAKVHAAETSLALAKDSTLDAVRDHAKRAKHSLTLLQAKVDSCKEAVQWYDAQIAHLQQRHDEFRDTAAMLRGGANRKVLEGMKREIDTMQSRKATVEARQQAAEQGLTAAREATPIPATLDHMEERLREWIVAYAPQLLPNLESRIRQNIAAEPGKSDLERDINALAIDRSVKNILVTIARQMSGNDKWSMRGWRNRDQHKAVAADWLKAKIINRGDINPAGLFDRLKVLSDSPVGQSVKIEIGGVEHTMALAKKPAGGQIVLRSAGTPSVFVVDVSEAAKGIVYLVFENGAKKKEYWKLKTDGTAPSPTAVVFSSEKLP